MEMLRKALGMRGLTQEMRERVPPGQYVTPKFPVMSLGMAPAVDVDKWRLELFGMVEEPKMLTWQEFLALGKDAEVADFHCVTQWSRLNVTWEGVPGDVLLEVAKPQSEAKFVMFHCSDGYTTNLDIDALRRPDSLLAYRQDGAALAPEHGGPMRLVVPALYGWKSAKWVHGIEFMAEDRAGFWEARGYHMRGDPWKEERFS